MENKNYDCPFPERLWVFSSPVKYIECQRENCPFGLWIDERFYIDDNGDPVPGMCAIRAGAYAAMDRRYRPAAVAVKTKG